MDYYSKVYFLSVTLLLIGGGACHLLGLWKRRAGGALAALCTLGALVLAGMLWRGAPGLLGFQPVFELPAPLSLVLKFGVSPFIGALNFLVVLFGFCVVLYSLSYWRTNSETHRFYAFALWAVAATSIALCARHLLVFLFAWEAVTAVLYLLIGTGGPAARAGAAKTFSILGFGDAALVLAVLCVFVIGRAQSLDIDYLQGPGRIALTSGGHVLLYLLFLTAALAKAGAFPLHTWVPAAAEHAPVPTMALLPASLDKLLGIVLLARISLGFFADLTLGLKLLLMLIGAVTIISAVMMAMIQHELKKLLSFHAVSQVGYMVLGIGTGVPAGIAGGLFHMVNNAVYKCLLFLSAGAVESRTGELELDNLGGLARAMPLTATGFIVGSLAISGTPPLNGFVSKWMIYQGVIEGGGYLMPILLAAAVLGSALTLASFVKAMHGVFFGERSPALAGKDVREVGWNMLFPIGLFSGLCVVLGIAGGFVGSAIFNAGMAEFGRQPTAQAASFSAAFWGPMQAVLLILVGFALGLVVYAAGRTMKIRRVRSFLGGEVNMPAPTNVTGTGFYLTVRDLPFIRGVYGDAERSAFDVYRLSGQMGGQAVSFLRKLHTGVVATYVTWVVVGVGALMALLFLLR